LYQGTASSRAAKPFKMNNSTLPKAGAKQSGVPRKRFFRSLLTRAA